MIAEFDVEESQIEPTALCATVFPAYGPHMSTFLVRVELHGVKDYIPLHEAMKKLRFKRVIKRSDGKAFTLPNGEYRYRSGASIGVVVRRARKATSAVNYQDASIIVSEIQGVSRFSKLKEDRSVQ
jgi:hypothetical protein